MTAGLLGILVVLALLDGAFSGFRAALGRTGLVDHVAEDRAGLRRGVALVALLALPAITSMVVDVTIGGGSMASYRAACLSFLAVVGPYAVMTGGALGVYALSRWELRYLASAVILGPCTLLRSYVVVVAAVVAVARTPSPGVSVTATLAVSAVLLVEPILNQRHRARRLVGTTPTLGP